jgi:HlyD family secretion protein
MHPNPRRIIPVILLLALAAAAWWYFSSGQAQAEVPLLTASGTIEATQVVVAPELGGQVVEVLAAEGDTVKAGQVLVRFDGAILQAQLAQAQSALAVAKANYELVAAGPTSEQRQVAITAAQLELTNARQAIKDLNDGADLAAAQARQAVAAIDKARDQATQRLDNLNSNADQADIDAAQAAVVIARDKLDKAKDKFEPYEKKSEDNVQRAILQSQVADAQNRYDSLVTRLNNLLGTSNQYDLAVAEADKAMTEAQLADAQRKYDDLKSGPDPDALALAQARLANAEANLAAAQADPSPQQLAVAQAQVDSAQAALQVIQTQIDKLVLYAPLDAVVLTRSVEPGETALPGAPLLTLARLDSLKITIYLPEDRYGEVKLGQSAQVQVDSFPGTTFTATVVNIADQAEFTPRNVQTAEGRQTTVFAVKLAIDPAGGKLKPGMPADVSFGN